MIAKGVKRGDENQSNYDHLNEWWNKAFIIHCCSTSDDQWIEGITGQTVCRTPNILIAKFENKWIIFFKQTLLTWNVLWCSRDNLDRISSTDKAITKLFYLSQITPLFLGTRQGTNGIAIITSESIISKECHYPSFKVSTIRSARLKKNAFNIFRPRIKKKRYTHKPGFHVWNVFLP